MTLIRAVSYAKAII